VGSLADVVATVVLTAGIATVVAGVLFAGFSAKAHAPPSCPALAHRPYASRMGSSTDDESEVSAILLANVGLRTRRVRWRKRLNGEGRERGARETCSQRGRVRRPNVDRDFEAGFRRIIQDDFGWRGRPPFYDERMFERRFRLPRAIVFEIYAKLQYMPFWLRSINATGSGTSTLARPAATTT